MKSIKIKYSFLLVLLICSGTIIKSQNIFQDEVNSYLKDVPFKMPAINLPVFADRKFNIVDFGAKGDGEFLNTEAFKKAIEECTKSGGGKIIVPSGLWLTGPIELKSNVDLHLEKGALILFSRNHNDYPIDKIGGSLAVTPPIYSYKQENISITGDGIIDASGETWRPVKKSKMTESQWKNLLNSGGSVNKKGDIWWPTKEALEGEDYLNRLKKSKNKKDLTAEDLLPARDYLRPNMVTILHCKNVLLQGVTFENSPKFAVNPKWCENIVISGIKINNEWWAQNGDGIDISSCKNVLIYKCTVNAGDDGICVKSSYDKDYPSPNLENVVVKDCVVYHGHGGFVIGSNTDGGMNNVYVNNCNFIGTDIGLRFKSARGRGGIVENFFISNIYMKDIVNEAILFDTYYDSDEGGDEEFAVNKKTPVFQNFKLNDVYCNGADVAVAANGLPEMPIKNISFSNSTISANSGFKSKFASGFKINNMKIIPAKGEVFNLNQTSDFEIINGFCPAGTDTFLKLEGNKTSNIYLIKTDLSSAKTPVEFGAGVDKISVINKNQE